MWIERNISGVLKRALAQFPAVVLTGARQTGKTSLVKRLFPRADYISFDIPREAEAAKSNAEDFLAGHSEPMIFDEVQYVPEILRHLKISIDRDRRAGRYVLTGSQDFPLMQGVTESLAGRCAVLSLPTLSLPEVFPATTMADMDAFCWRGGFPDLWQNRETDRELWLGSYMATYLERDVRNILNVGRLRDFDRFLRAAALRAGRLLSFSELARDVGIAPNTARSWLSILEASRQVFLLEPYHTSATKRLVKTPKLYFTDTGLLLYLMGFQSWSTISTNAAWGLVWENLVISETLKYFINRGKRPPTWFWRTAHGEEIDLLIELGPERFLAVECKTAASIRATDIRNFSSLKSAYGEQALVKGAVVCRVDSPGVVCDDPATAVLPLAGKGGFIEWLDANSKS